MNTDNKILVVDDDAHNCELFQVMLGNLGFTVEEAVDGYDALEKLKEFHPDLILMDNIMPGMTGWELTKKLKNDPKYWDIPIIMLSAIDDVKDKVASFDLGIEDYITKPFNFSEVLARIKAAMRNKELFAQIAVRESRLSLAEELSRDLKKDVTDFVKSIDELDDIVLLLPKDGKPLEQETLTGLVNSIHEKTGRARRQIAEIDTRLDKTILEWEVLKKNEIGLSVLEKQIRKHLSREE
jgi:DNA-binding response OmpR family regulator